MHKILEQITETLSLKPKYNKVSWSGNKPLYYICFTELHTISHNYLPVYLIYCHIKEVGSIKTPTRRQYFALLIQIGILFYPSPSSELTSSRDNLSAWKVIYAEQSCLCVFSIVVKRCWIWIHLYFGNKNFLQMKILCLTVNRFKHGSPQCQFPYNWNYSSKWGETLMSLKHKTLKNNLKTEWLH